MVFNKNETMAQFSDRFLRLVAFALLLMSVSYASAAVGHYVRPEFEDLAQTVRVVFGLSAAGIVILPFIKMMWLRIKAGNDCQAEPEGYIAGIYAKSTIASFSTAFVGMILLEPITAKVLTDLPPAFVIQTVLALMMATLGISFFIQLRGDDGEMDDEFEDELNDEAGPAQ
jgi:hypothetical protein